MSRSERNLNTSLTFGGHDSPLDLQAIAAHDFPFPRLGEPLLLRPVGAESDIRSYAKSGFKKLGGLGFFALFYVERARELVRVWLDSHESAENFVYPVGFLYRHCIELNMKAAIVRSSWFRSLDLTCKQDVFKKHDLSALWDWLKPIVSEYMEAKQIAPFAEQLRELARLDAKSEGFRYPFGRLDSETGDAAPLLEGLAGMSFDNLVWVLDGMVEWLSHTADAEQDYHEMLDYMGQP
jgi:hypothetical protein